MSNDSILNAKDSRLLATMKLIDGSDYEIRSDDPEMIKHFENPHNYTKEIIAQFEDSYYKKFITPDDKVILDIGANIGLFSLHVSPWATNIFCVEPTPSHFEKLYQNLQAIQFIDGLWPACRQAALAGLTGKVKFHWCGINTTMNSLQPRGDKSFEVEGITLPDLVESLTLNDYVDIDFCKIDIEGSEHEAITAEFIAAVAPRVKKFFMEVHPPDQVTVDKFVPMFEAAGYKVERYVHDSIYAVRQNADSSLPLRKTDL